MSLYQFLEDCYIAGVYFQAGTQSYTADILATGTIPNTLPIGWVPNAAVTPIDANAITAFYGAGPQPPPLIVQRWQTQSVPPPSIYWKGTPTQGATMWTLVGTNMPAIYE